MSSAAHVGIVGGGQLARMTIMAALPLGIAVTVLDPDPACPAAAAGATVLCGDANDLDALTALAERVDVVTFDHERVPLEHLRVLERSGFIVAPGSSAAELAFDKAAARRCLGALGYPIPEHVVADDATAITTFAAHVGWPIVLKAGRGGYDGRGVAVVHSPAEADEIARAWGPGLVAEAFVPFDGELAVIVARRASGQRISYAPVGTQQRHGMCVEVVHPAPVAEAVQHRARYVAEALADDIGLVGVMAVELFVTGDQLTVNEVATRPHNTGHHTIEACVTSQFEQHLRAILDWPLGSAEARSPAAVMRNVVGSTGAPDPVCRVRDALGAGPQAHIHLYGKTPRPGRKLGHVTALAETVDEARHWADVAVGALTSPGAPASGRRPDARTADRGSNGRAR